MNLVIGASGQVGHYLMAAIHGQKRGTCFTHAVSGLKLLDISNPSMASVYIDRLKPRIIYLPASLTNVGYCESNPDESYAVNVKGVRNVVKTANRHGSHLVYFSSDYIFDGENGPYIERDLANPINVYGRHKLAAEHYIMKWSYSYFIVRTTVVYSWERKCCVARWITSLRNNTPISVPMDQIGTPTYAPNLAEIVVELAEARAKGVAHITGPDLISRYEFAMEVARTFELDETLVWGLESQALHQKAARPMKAGMRSTELSVAEKDRLVGVREGLGVMREIEC